MITGEHVALGPMRRELLPLYQRWYNDLSMYRTEWPQSARPHTLEEMEVWYDQWATASPSQRINFTVYLLGDWRAIGTTSLHGIDLWVQTAQFGITIGDPADRGHGYGTEAARLTLDYAFTVLGMHNVSLSALAYNRRGLRCFEHAGFKEFGRRREAALLNGRRYDGVYMDCLAREFTSPVLAKVFHPDVKGTDA